MDAFALTPPHTTPVTAPVMLPVIAPALVQWQAQHGRNHLPWQATRDPYRVWLSEIMLQQTQVATVLGYYSRFLAALRGNCPPCSRMTAWAQRCRLRARL